MALKTPDSMDELIYFTNRTIGSGKAKMWVFKGMCPKCRKGIMGKPTDKKGKVLIRAKTYVCKECGYTAEKEEYEDTLTASAQYTCPDCGFAGESEVPFKRKKVAGADAVIFTCGKCGKKIPVTKKMKEV
jgi:predicted RNA-binding Zn-ribbon protein involved in translation (DUF1610 family)